MKIIPPERFPQRDAESFLRFLQYCQERARKRGLPQLASVCLKVRPIDALAVLDSIYEARHRHFYLERPQAAEALAGAEAVVWHQATGSDRFQSLLAYARQLSAEALAIGDLEAPLAGPKCFVTFNFEADDNSCETGFAPATLFVPRWQVECRQGQYYAVANTLVEPTGDLSAIAERILGAHRKFSGFNYSDVATAASPQVEATAEVTADYETAVRGALQGIQEGRYEKIVLARAIDAIANAPFIPLETVHRLRERYPACYCFSVNNGCGQSFIGASPERLVRLLGGRLETEAIAGSIARGRSAREDAQLAAELMQSEKDLREHRHVLESIREHLANRHITIRAPEQPEILKLQNVQHLRTPITADLGDTHHILEIAEVLHPTPAVGGRPRQSVLPAIAQLEDFPRGLFAGLLGWFDFAGQGELAVGLRSGLFNGQRARLYAGAGIVAGSDPAREMAETQMKLRALQDAIQ